MLLQGCSGVKEVVSAGPVWIAAGQEAEIRAVQAGQVPPVQGVLSAMWNFMSTFDFDQRSHACLLHHRDRVYNIYSYTFQFPIIQAIQVWTLFSNLAVTSLILTLHRRTWFPNRDTLAEPLAL